MIPTARRFASTNVVIVGAKRTPVGSFMGALSGLSAPHLGTVATTGALASCNVDPKEVEEVYMGCVLQAGMGQSPARQVALGSKMTEGTVATDINKVCASGMKSMMISAESIMLGHRNVMVSGGMECMSKTPHYAYLRKPTGFGEAMFPDSIKADGLTDVYNQILMGSCTEKVVTDFGISRQAQDDFAIESYNRARRAQESGVLDWEICDVIIEGKKGTVRVSKDEECQKFMPDKFPGLKPAFAKNGTITAANSSKINDGACAFVLMSEDAAKERGLKPLARIVSFDDAAVAPIDFAIAPAKACQGALQRAGLSMKDIEYHEINEAFSAVTLANMKLLDLDHKKVNVHGGAVAMGHPIGASGSRIILSLMNVLRTNQAKLGMASICNGGGGASAIVIERM